MSETNRKPRLTAAVRRGLPLLVDCMGFAEMHARAEAKRSNLPAKPHDVRRAHEWLRAMTAYVLREEGHEEDASRFDGEATTPNDAVNPTESGDGEQQHSWSKKNG